MADNHTHDQRSFNMSRIRSSDTKPEEFIRRELFRRGYRYRKNDKRIVGHPDLWMSKYNLAVFVNGCFWHRHEGCRYSYMPKSNTEYWKNKFLRNIARDKKVMETLSEQGVRMLVIWECTVKKMQKSEAEKEVIMKMIEAFIHGENGQMFLQI